MAALTAEKVVIELQANTQGYVANINAADKQFTAAMTHINSQAPRATAAIGSLTGQTANMAAQFQDIAVQLQSGASPLTIALQQGTQLSAVLQSTANPIKALGAAFVSLINPVSLATIGFIALGSVAVQYFATLLDNGKLSAEELKKQEDSIRSIADKWGEAVPALKAYVDQLDRAKDLQNLGTAQSVISKEFFQPVIDQLDEVRAKVGAAQDQLFVMGTEGAGAADKLGAAFGDFEQKVSDGTATQEDYERILRQVTDLANSSSAPAFANLARVITGLGNAFSIAAGQALQLAAASDEASQNSAYRLAVAQQKFIEAKEHTNTLTTQQLALENEIARVQADAKRTTGSELGAEEAKRIAEQTLSAEERRAKIKKDLSASLKADNSSAKEADHERQAVIDLISALEFEQSLLGQSKEDQAVMVALRKAGAAATQEQRDRITELVQGTYEETQALADAKKTMDAIQSLSGELLKGFVNDLREGKSAAEALGNVFDKLADKLVDIAVQNLVGAAFGALIPGGGAAGGGNLLSGLGTLFGGKRAAGGSVQKGKAYGIGERGPEMFVPNVSGTIIPNNALGGSGGGQIYVSAIMQVIDGNLVPVITKVSGQVAGQTVRQYDSGLQDRQAEKSLRYG